MTGLLAAEWVKLSRRWVLRVLALILVALCGLTGFIFLILPDLVPDVAQELPILDRRDALILGIQTVLGQTWFPLILAVVMLGSEVTTSAWGASLTRESRRGRHVGAKLGVMLGGAWLVVLVVIGLWVAGATVFSEGESGFSTSDWIGVVWKSGLAQVTWLALGMGAVAWIRSTGFAIGIVIVYSFGEGILALWKPFQRISLSTAQNALFGEISADISGGIGVGFTDPMTFSRAVLVVAMWTVVGAALAYTGLRYRDA
jgi:hypothetical protein